MTADTFHAKAMVSSVVSGHTAGNEQSRDGVVRDG
jgi:hypothetical protein